MQTAMNVLQDHTVNHMVYPHQVAYVALVTTAQEVKTHPHLVYTLAHLDISVTKAAITRLVARLVTTSLIGVKVTVIHVQKAHIVKHLVSNMQTGTPFLIIL